MKTLIVAAALAVLPTLAFAQSAPITANSPGLEKNPGLGEMSKPKEEIRVEENSILPNAGASAQSAAPTMKLDCQAKPSDCSEPVTTGSTLPQQSK